jgi:hypothetical protein
MCYDDNAALYEETLEWEHERMKPERAVKQEKEIPASVITVKAQAPNK